MCCRCVALRRVRSFLWVRLCGAAFGEDARGHVEANRCNILVQVLKSVSAVPRHFKVARAALHFLDHRLWCNGSIIVGLRRRPRPNIELAPPYSRRPTRTIALIYARRPATRKQRYKATCIITLIRIKPNQLKATEPDVGACSFSKSLSNACLVWGRCWDRARCLCYYITIRCPRMLARGRC